jgi:colanic acid/amylovoran biosynthesis glycosyltransferase
MCKKIAYVMSRFPHLPETFILREMIELERLGWQIELYPLIIQHQLVVHDEVHQWLSRANRVPMMSTDVFRANVRAFLNNPKLYLRIWWQVIWGNRTSIGFLSRAILLLPKSVKMAELMKKRGIRHIHAHYATHPALAAWIISKLTNISYSITVHAHDIFMDKAMLNVKMRDAKMVIAISEFNRKYLAEHVGTWIEDKTQVVHCGVDSDLYRTSRKDGTNSILQILSIGSLQPYKGHIYLIEACDLLRRKGVKFLCHIVGGGYLRDSLEKRIEALGLRGLVELVGPKTQQEVARLLGQADCYVQPSVIAPDGQMEGIPVALMEAMACNLPVVATSISGIPELVRDGETGWLIPPESPMAIANVVAEIKSRPEEASKRSLAGRKLIEKNFNLKINGELLALEFEKLTRIFDKK